MSINCLFFFTGKHVVLYCIYLSNMLYSRLICIFFNVVINVKLKDGSEGMGGGGRLDDGRVGGYEGENGIVVFKLMNIYYIV